MAIGRVPGAALLADLDRQGLDLAFSSEGNDLLKLDFTNYRIGINTASPNAELDVTGNIILDGNISPRGHLTSNIGSATQRFNTLYAKSANVSTIVAGTYYFSDGQQLSANYSNISVATYLPTDSTIIGIQANLVAGNVYANSLVTVSNIGMIGYVNSQVNAANIAWQANALAQQTQINALIAGSSSYSNVQVATYLPTDSTIIGIQANLVAGNTFVTTSVTTANIGMKGYVDANVASLQSQINAFGGGASYGNANVSAYLPTDSTIIGIQANLTAGNTYALSQVTTANIGMIGYVNNQVNNANLALKGYVDAQDTAGNVFASSLVITANIGMLGYVNNQVTTSINAANIGMIGYVSSQVNAANIAWQANALAQQAQINSLSAGAYSNVQVATYLPTDSTIIGIHANLVAGNVFVTTSVNNANIGMIGYVNSVGAAGNAFTSNQSIAGNTYALSQVTTANIGMLGYVNNQVTTSVNNANLALKGYVDAQDTAGNIFTTSSVTTANIGMKGYVDANVASLQSQINAFGGGASYGNANVATYLPTDSTIIGIQANLVAGNVFATTSVNTANVGMIGYVNNQVNAANIAWQANALAQQTQINALSAGAYSNVQVATYLPTDSTIIGIQANLLAGNAFVTTSVNTANIGMLGYVNSVGAAGNAFTSNQSLASNIFATGAVTTANIGMIGYVNNQVNAANIAWQANALAQQAQINSLSAGAYSNVQVATYLPTDSTIIGIQANLIAGNTFVTTSVNNANLALKGYVDAQDTAGNVFATTSVNTANVGMIGYVNNQVTTTINTANIGMIGYVNSVGAAGNAFTSNQSIAGNTYALSQVTTANIGMKGYVDANVAILQAQINSFGGGASYGNANVGVYLPTDSTIIGIKANLTAGNVFATTSVNNANLALKGYVDSQDTAGNVFATSAVTTANIGMLGYVVNQVNAANVAWQANALAQQAQINSLSAGAYSNVQVATYLPTDSTIIGIQANLVAGNTFVTTSVNNANLALKGYVDSQDTAGNVFATASVNTANIGMIGYVNSVGAAGNAFTSNQSLASNVFATSAVTTANIGMLGYVNNQVTTSVNNANLALKGYIDAQDTAGNVFAISAVTTANIGMIGYVGQQVTTANIGMKGYVDANVASLQSQINAFGGGASYGNANVSVYIPTDLTIIGIQANLVAGNTFVTTSVNTANIGMIGYVNSVGAAGNAFTSNQSLASNVFATVSVTTANIGMIGFVNNQINTANVGQQGYIDAQNNAGNAFVTSSVNNANLAMKGYVDSVAGLSSYGNTQVATYLPTDPTITGIQANLTAGNLFVTSSVNAANVGQQGYIDAQNNAGNAFVTSSVNTANIGMIGFVTQQATAGNAFTSNQALAGNTFTTTSINTANIGMIGYVGQQVNNANLAMIGFVNNQVNTANIGQQGYIDAQNLAGNAFVTTSVSTANIGMLGYVSSQVNAANVAWQANALAQQTQINSLAAGVYSNVQVATYLPEYNGELLVSRLILSNIRVALGATAGTVNQGDYSIAIGQGSGNVNQASYAIAIGDSSAANSQASGAVAIGVGAGYDSQGTYAVALGSGAGGGGQGERSIAIGENAGSWGQGIRSIAIGAEVGASGQGNNSIVIGAGASCTTANTIVIGYCQSLSLENVVPTNSIILNATGFELMFESSASSGFYVTPVRNDSGNVSQAIYYNETTKELTYANASGSYSNVQVATYLPTDSTITGIQANLVAGNVFVTTSVNTANIGMIGYVNSVGAAGNAFTSNQSIAGNTYALSQVTTANIGMIGYVNNQVTTSVNNANLALKGYVDSQNLAGNVFATASVTTANIGMIGYVNTQVNAANVAWQANALAQQAQINSLSAGGYSNVQVATYLPTYTGNITAGNVISGAFYSNSYYYANGLPYTFNTTITDRQFVLSSGDVNGNVNGVNSVFTLQSTATTSSVIITINGIVQTPTLAYSVSGNSLTFTEPPLIGDEIDARILATASTITHPTFTRTSIAYNTTLLVDCYSASTFDMTLTGNVTLGFNNAYYDGQKITARIKQDATGNRLVTFDSTVRFGSTITSFVATTTASKTDVVELIYHQSDNKFDVVSVAKGF